MVVLVGGTVSVGFRALVALLVVGSNNVVLEEVVKDKFEVQPQVNKRAANITKTNTTLIVFNTQYAPIKQMAQKTKNNFQRKYSIFHRENQVKRILNFSSKCRCYNDV